MPRATLETKTWAALALLLLPASARAQFIGAGSTVQGDYLRGVGVAGWGMGLYNLNTARGERINAETAIMVNEYMAAVAKQENHENAVHRAMVRAKHEENYQKNLERMRNSPEEKDVMRGAALNMLRERLMDPNSESAMRVSQVPLNLPGNTIRNIPFFFAQEDATISLSRLSAKGKWPVGLRGPEFDAYRRAYERALDRALDLVIESKGKLRKEVVEDVAKAVNDLLVRLDDVLTPSRDKIYLDAKNFLKHLEKQATLFRSQKIEQIMGEIDKYGGTTVYDLLLFMQRNNLIFGVAEEIGDERTLYPKLYAIMQEQGKAVPALDNNNVIK